MTIMLSSSPLEYTLTLQAWILLLFVVFPIIGLSFKVISTVILVALRILYSIYLFIYYDPQDRYPASQVCEVEKIDENSEIVLTPPPSPSVSSTSNASSIQTFNNNHKMRNGKTMKDKSF